MDSVIKYTVLGMLGLLLFATAGSIFGPIIFVILTNPVLLGTTILCGLGIWLYRMKRDNNNV